MKSESRRSVLLQQATILNGCKGIVLLLFFGSGSICHANFELLSEISNLLFTPTYKKIDLAANRIIFSTISLDDYTDPVATANFKSRWLALSGSVPTHVDGLNLQALQNLDGESTALMTNWLNCYKGDLKKFSHDYLHRQLNCGSKTRDLLIELGLLHNNVTELASSEPLMWHGYSSPGTLPQLSPLFGQILIEMLAFSRKTISDVYVNSYRDQIGQRRIYREATRCKRYEGLITDNENIYEKNCSTTRPAAIHYFYSLRIFSALKQNCSNYGLYSNATFYLFSESITDRNYVVINHPIFDKIPGRDSQDIGKMNDVLQKYAGNCWGTNARNIVARILKDGSNAPYIVPKINGYIFVFSNLYSHYSNMNL